jgi:hypothetical protein
MCLTFAFIGPWVYDCMGNYKGTETTWVAAETMTGQLSPGPY